MPGSHQVHWNGLCGRFAESGRADKIAKCSTVAIPEPEKTVVRISDTSNNGVFSGRNSSRKMSKRENSIGALRGKDMC